MYFVDPDLEKNKNYFVRELNNLSAFYSVPLHLFYESEFFTHFGHPEFWNDLTSWFVRWKSELPDFPDVNLDLSPKECFDELVDLPIGVWRRFVTNDHLWDEGIVQVLFKDGITLRLVLNEFRSKPARTYQALSDVLALKIHRYYPPQN
jgi:hypothetical protein